MKPINSLSELTGDEVALLQVDPNTGVPVNESGEWLKKGEARFIRFENETQAREFAAARLKENPLLEWSLIDSKGEQKGVLHNREALTTISKPKIRRKGFWSRLFK